MTPNRSRPWTALAAAAALFFPPATAFAQLPLSQDADGNVTFRTPDGTVLSVGIDGKVSVDGEVLVDCHATPRADVDTAAGEAECYGGYIEVQDRHGNALEVYPTYADAETDDGDSWELPLSRSPVQVRVDVSGGTVRVETAAETVVVGESGGVAVTGPAGEEVIVEGDDLRIRAGGATVTGDWRGAGRRWGSADTESLLIELGATREDDLIRLAMAGDVLFDFDSTAIRPDAAEQLAKAAHVIRQRSVGEVYVVGHTDSIGSDDYNARLSKDRAVAVMSWLSHNEGIPASVMVGRGVGATRPVAHNTRPDGSDDPEGRARNRRVEILLATKEGVDVVNVAGLVTVTGDAVEVGGGAVRVDEDAVEVGGGAIRVDEESVNVGGIEISAEGINVGGVTVPHGGGTASRVVDDETPAVCKTGETCNFRCPDGDCEMTCQPGANCNFTCSGGDCRMTCKPGATCNFTCSGGDCLYECPLGSTCNTTCSGGDCRRG